MRPRIALIAAALAVGIAVTPLAAQTPSFLLWQTPETKPSAPAASPTAAPKPAAPAPVSTEAAKPAPPAEQPAPPAAEPPPPYEPQLLRLAEVIGALSYLRDLCGAGDGAAFRAKFANLMETEGTTPARKETLAGAFNRGFRGYELTYRACTPAAREIVTRFLDEAARIAKDVASRYAG